MTTKELQSKARAFSIKKWNILDSYNKENPNTTSMLFSGKTWTARIWIEETESYSRLRYQYKWTRGRNKGKIFSNGYFAI